MKASIYHYKTASRYLVDRTLQLQKNQPGFSIRKWAKEMGFPSHSLLTMILQGKRNLTLRQVPFLAKGLALSTPERMFFQALIQVENARTPEEKEWCELWLNDLRPVKPDASQITELDEYLSIADWIHSALLALSDTAESFIDAETAHAQLGAQHTVLEIRAALARLCELKLLKKDQNSRYRATYARVTTKDDIATRGVREYHQQCATLASEKIASQSRHLRELQSMAIAIPQTKLPLAKELIRKFRTQFAAAMQSEHADQVYQFNLHFFRLTENPPEMVLEEGEGVDFKPVPEEIYETH